MIGASTIIALLLSAGSTALQTVADTARAQGVPRSFQIVRINAPRVLANESTVGYAGYAVNEFTMIGRAAGAIHPPAGAALVTVGIPANAPAGTREAARMLFIAGGKEASVSVIMTVLPVYGLSLQADPEVAGLRSGDRFELPFKVTNRGNAVDTVRIIPEMPAGWRPSVRDTPTIIIAPFSTVQRVLNVAVPNSSATGNFFIRLNARSREARAEALVTLSVGPVVDQLRPLGPTVRAAVGAVGVEGGTVQSVPQIAVSGPVTNRIYVDGRLTASPTLAAAQVRGLASVGTFVTSPHLVAWSSRWRATLGSTVLAMTDLTGVNAGGRGFAFEHQDTARVLSFVGARPDKSYASGSDSGELLGAHFEQNLRYMRVGATATRLRGVGLQHHELTAIGVQARTFPIGTFIFGGETAYREYAAGSGMGWTARVRHDRKDEQAEFRLTHAPGGAEAFARAENELQISFARGRREGFGLAGSYVTTEDDTRPMFAFQSHSLSLSPSYAVSRTMRIRGDIRRTSFDVDAAPIGYGNAETHAGIGMSGAWRGFGYATDIGAARLSRSISAADIDAADHGSRLTWRLNAIRTTSIGAFQLEASYERNSAATGYLPEQIIVGLRSDRIHIPSLSNRLELEGEVMIQSWSGAAATPIVRAGAQYSIFETTIALGIERNPLLNGLKEKTPWIMALKLEKSLGLPRIAMGRASGIVYRDLNGNGQRDTGEPGVGGVLVRSGVERAVSSSDGAYRFADDPSSGVQIDPNTLPDGWIVGERRDGSIALVSTTRLEVTLELGAAERVRGVNLSGVTVIARDAYGREWTGRRTGEETAVFEALPVGDYTLDADFTRMAEPLRIDGNPVTVQVREGVSATAKLPIAGRRLRFRQNQ